MQRAAYVSYWCDGTRCGIWEGLGRAADSSLVTGWPLHPGQPSPPRRTADALWIGPDTIAWDSVARAAFLPSHTPPFTFSSPPTAPQLKRALEWLRPEDRYEKRRYAAVLILHQLAQVLHLAPRGQGQPASTSASNAAILSRIASLWIAYVPCHRRLGHACADRALVRRVPLAQLISPFSFVAPWQAAPTVFNVHIQTFISVIWAGLWDSRLVVREARSPFPSTPTSHVRRQIRPCP